MTQTMHRLRTIRHLTLDLDGTLYLGGRLFEATLPFLELLDRLGIGRTFFTNNSSRSTKQYIEHLRNLGIPAEVEDLYSSTHSTLDYLRAERPQVRSLYVLGTPALCEEFAEAGYVLKGDDEGPPDAVVVGFDTTLSYPRVCRAAWWISQGKPFIATHPDRICPTDKPTMLPDCAAICKMLSCATGREPDAVLGKPTRRMLEGVLRRHGLTTDQLGVVGDRLYTDMLMARSAGAMGILVLSGETTPEQAQAADPQPDLIVRDVGELAELLRSDRR